MPVKSLLFVNEMLTPFKEKRKKKQKEAPKFGGLKQDGKVTSLAIWVINKRSEKGVWLHLDWSSNLKILYF